MARNIGADGSTVYRAVITKSIDGREWTSHEGPYTEPGPARVRVSFWRNRMRRNGGTAEGHVEQAHTVWTRVGEDADPTAAAVATELRALADAISALPQDYECDPGRGETAEMLRRRADELHPAPEEQQQ
ncbi:hypothetical protein [Streptomyces pseudogriseolus]|uniref:hypothetical protein n=1 Tax=Streptomyces pseudogriseolus TaxID=36817 RepID=UPI003FA335B2